MTTESLLTRIRRRHKLDDATEIIVKNRAAEVEVDETDPYLFTATITSDALDRDDEVLLPNGMISAEFERSGAVFFNHDYDKICGIPRSLKASRAGVEAKARFMERPEDHQGEFFPDYVRAFVTQMAKAGRQPGVSVGFIPLESRNPSKKDKEQYGERCRRVHTKWNLLEWSIAPVQSNPDAVVTMVGKGLLSPVVAKAVYPGIELPNVVVRRRLVVLLPEWKQAKPKPKRVIKPRMTGEQIVCEAVADELARRQGKVYR